MQEKEKKEQQPWEKEKKEDIGKKGGDVGGLPKTEKPLEPEKR